MPTSGNLALVVAADNAPGDLVQPDHDANFESIDNAVSALQATGTSITIEATTALPYTILATDVGKSKRVNSSTAGSVQVNLGVIGPGEWVEVVQWGVGQVTFVAGTGVTFRPSSRLKTAEQGSAVRLLRYSGNASLDEILITGDVVA